MEPPKALEHVDESQARAYLRQYYSPGQYSGALFDTFDPSGTREKDADRFTSDDLVAVSLLSVNVPGRAAHEILVSRRNEFSDLLRDMGPDRDLAGVADTIREDSPGYVLLTRLKELDGVGPVVASKLLARKRPRLRPIYDDVVANVLGDHTSFWEPMRLMLRDSEFKLHHQLLSLRSAAGLPEAVSAIRVLDVIAWMEGKDRGQDTGATSNP